MNIELPNWIPMAPALGPPLPRFLKIHWPWYKPPLPEPPEESIVVGLLNPPAGANRWGLTLYDSSGEKSLRTTVYSIDGEASFDIPADWVYPLRFWISVIYYPDNSVTVLHQAQSLSPDWPNYREEFIPELGSYYYNVATEHFEKG